MADISTKVVNLVEAVEAWKAYVNENGVNPGNETYDGLVAARNASISEHEASLTSFVQALINA